MYWRLKIYPKNLALKIKALMKVLSQIEIVIIYVKIMDLHLINKIKAQTRIT